MDELELNKNTFKKNFGIDFGDKDIDEILGISELNLKPYVWKPYLQKFEKYLQIKLKEYLLAKQRQSTNGLILNELIFQEFKNIYILITPVKEVTKKRNTNGELKDFTHVIITFYDAQKGYQNHIKKAIIRVSQCNGNFYYNKIKISINAFYEPIREKLNSIHLFTNRGNHIQGIYLSRLLPTIKFINNDLTMKPMFEGHHVFFDTQFEMNSEYSMLLIAKNKHSEIFHPNNTQGSNDSNANQAKGILLNNMLKIKYFKTKEKKFNADIRFNIQDILMYRFVEKKSISEIQKLLKNKNPKRSLTYNTIKSIIEHFTQYTPVLTASNIEQMWLIEK